MFKTASLDFFQSPRRAKSQYKRILRFSNTTGILRKKTMWFIGVEVEQESSAPPPPPKKNPGSAPGKGVLGSERNARGSVVSRGLAP